MVYFGLESFRFAVFLFVLFPGWTTFPQGMSHSPKPEDSPAKTHAQSGVFLYTYRTPAHLHRSSPQVFQQAVDKVSQFLTSKNVPIRRVVQAAPSRKREQGTNEDYENLSVSRDNQAPSLNLLAKARASGARYVLFLVVDRPVMSWIQLRMRCFDLSGSLLWETQSANSSALTSKSGLQQTLEGLQARIFNKTDELSRALEETPTGDPLASTQASTSGQSEIVLSQPSPEGVEKQSSNAASAELIIEKGEPVSLLLLDTISSKGLKVADRVRFRVIDPVVIDHLVVVLEGPKGGER